MTLKQDTTSITTSISNPTLLAKVDQLRDLNIGQHVPLPQLVVVGDQSSGKSSLLESLSGVPFPKDQNLCTRHATQITSRRDKDECVHVRIIPGPRASEDHKKQVEAFQTKVSSASEFRDKFVDILKKANEKMGLRTDLSSGHGGAIFSEDVLKIEVHGPREDYLTIIDVPGIFRTTVHGTTKDDMVMVKNLVKRYIRDDRTIILAVLPSNVDIATQEILELAEEYDKNGKRTLGVLTKPDLVMEPTMRASVCDLVMGQKRPLTLGYFLVQNRSSDDGVKTVSELDQGLRIQPWSDLPKDRVGILALKEQLQSLLLDITRREFPKLVQDVASQIRQCTVELNKLGPSRQDEREQRSFLSRMAGIFQDRARAGLAADYNAHSSFNQTDLRLITHVVNLTDVFNADFQRLAHSRHFSSLEESQPLESPEPSDAGDRSESQSGLSVDTLRVLLEESGVDKISPKEQMELAEILVLPKDIPMPNEGFTDWIKEVYLQFRGLELGTFNPNLLSVAFTEQSRKWGDMTRIYMSRIIVTVHRFIAATLRSICPEEPTRIQLWAEILEGLLDCYRKAMAQADMLIQVQQRKQPYTLNRQFAADLSKSRGHRITALLRPKAKEDRRFAEPQYMVNLDDIAEAAEGKHNTELLQEEIHDILHAYYNLALDRYIDNIFQLAVDHSLLHGPDSPLKVFTQDWVLNLEARQLEDIAGETISEKKRRSRLSKKITDLHNALKILKSRDSY
ncbi:uncharacterized protein E0L32_003976 [Thyridium curvatum]|uniref:Uncharacterized protein n=1 Tax=Thyridium curvatum TaxID=1093900 RepID=A0A507B903_9PEZI|nr:uncharacterized protein E0L32_003976 [Thyridium curvatum]TPX16327.1 hypothetical protein E0L32_003976 [Thyridium curvatum]